MNFFVVVKKTFRHREKSLNIDIIKLGEKCQKTFLSILFHVFSAMSVCYLCYVILRLNVGI